MEKYLKNLEEKYEGWSNDELINAVNAHAPVPKMREVREADPEGNQPAKRAA